MLDDDDVRDVLGIAAEPFRRRYLEHRPGRSIVTRVAVGERGDGERLAAISIGHLEAASAGPCVAWYPSDPGLPGLSHGWPELTSCAGGAVGVPMAWVPHRRLVVACGEVVLKFHADPVETAHAVACAELAGARVRVPEVLEVDAALAVHAQRRLGGRPLGRKDAIDAIGAAAALLVRLRAAPAGALPEHSPTDLLESCCAVVELVSFAAPELAERATRLLDKLTAQQPANATLGSVGVGHGDFNVGQLVIDDDHEMALVDCDTLCVAPLAFDVASYAANLVSGRADDRDLALRVSRLLSDAVGDPPGVDWYLAAMVVRRLDRALRRCKRDWPQRTERLVADAEHLLARL